MHVLVLNPPSKKVKNVMRDVIYGCWCKGRRIGGLKLPPISLLLVATVLKNQKYNTHFIDGGFGEVEYAKLVKKSRDFDIVIISTSTHTFNEDRQLLVDFKKENKAITTICYGPRPTFLPELVLEKDVIDIVVRREPEFIIRDLITALERKDGSWKRIKGIGYIEGQKVILNDFYPYIENLDEIPFPDRTMLPRGVDYFSPVAKRYPLTTILTSRGCPARCTFCLSPTFFGNKVRYRSCENVLEELELISRQRYKEVFFRDETFTFFKERNIKICEEMLRRKLDITWVANARVGTVDREALIIMKEAGCHTIKFGVESGSQEILDRIKKGINIEQIMEAFKLVNKVGLKTHAHFMIGHPGETRGDVEKSIKLAKDLMPTTVSFGILTPYPGTPIFDEIYQSHPQITDHSFADFSKPDSGYLASLHCRMAPCEIEEFVKAAYRSFYLRPGYLLGCLNRVKNADEFKQLIIAGANIFEFSLFGDR